jgi:hypothetical protein
MIAALTFQQWKPFNELQVGSPKASIGVIGPLAQAREREPLILVSARLRRCDKITPSHFHPNRSFPCVQPLTLIPSRSFPCVQFPSVLAPQISFSVMKRASNGWPSTTNSPSQTAGPIR